MTHKEKKEKVDDLLKNQGVPFKFGRYLTSLSVARGWTDEDFKLYQEVCNNDNSLTVSNYTESEE